jgi:hypothetical protein
MINGDRELVKCRPGWSLLGARNYNTAPPRTMQVVVLTDFEYLLIIFIIVSISLLQALHH